MEILTRLEAMDYLRVNKELFNMLIKTGKLEGTYFVTSCLAEKRPKRMYIKSKLDEWMLNGGTLQFK